MGLNADRHTVHTTTNNHLVHSSYLILYGCLDTASTVYVLSSLLVLVFETNIALDDLFVFLGRYFEMG